MKAVEIHNERSLQNLGRFFNGRNINKLKETLKGSKIKFYIKNGRQRTMVPKKDLKEIDQCFLLTINHINPVSKPSLLVIFLFGQEINISPSASSLLKEGKISLTQTDCAINISINSEIYTEYWSFSFYDIAQRFTNYKIPVKSDDISRNFGLEGYKLILDIHNLTENLCSITERVTDFKIEGNKAVTWIEDLKLRILKEKMCMNWKSLAFSDKIKEVCIVDFILFSEFQNPICWGSTGCVLKFEEENGNEGNGYSLNINKNDFDMRICLRDKGASWMLVAVNIELSLAFISKYFRSNR